MNKQKKSRVPRKTPQDYHALALKRGLIWTGDNIVTTITKTGWKCQECGNKWQSSFHTISKGKGCPSCGKKARVYKTGKGIGKPRGKKRLKHSGTFAPTTKDKASKIQKHLGLAGGWGGGVDEAINKIFSDLGLK